MVHVLKRLFLLTAGMFTAALFAEGRTETKPVYNMPVEQSVLKEWKSEKGDVTITVPSQIWKAFVIITQDDSKDDLERIKNGETPVYASGIIMDNAPFDGSWTDAVVSIDEIEELTGLDLFSALPDTIETELESGTAAELPEVA